MVATKEVVDAHMSVLREMAEAIREAGEIPSGHLFAAVMDQLPLDRYEFYIGILKGAGVVKEEYNLLTWIGLKVSEVDKEQKEDERYWAERHWQSKTSM